MPSTKNIKIGNDYVTSIDGLRAIAVLLVVLFHAGFSSFTGGFIGVDVFFVISGFLITRNIVRQKEEGTFEFGKFYQRRIARLFPALFVVILSTVIISYFVLAPDDLKRLGKVAIYSSLSFSNLFFWMEAGYFDRASELKPLLHTWSLSVEEQFYMVWPALICLSYLFGKRKFLIVALTLISVFSVVASLYISDAHADAAFYLTPFRVYQFGIGGLIALTQQHTINQYKGWLAFVSVIGLALLTYSIDGNDSLVYTAILPAVLAGLFILGSSSPLVEKVFASGGAVWLGERSYSIYLVHWPIMVLWKISTDYHFSTAEKLLSVVCSIFFGYILHALVEQRFRFTPLTSTVMRYHFVTIALVLLIANVTVAAHLWGKDGYPDRVPKELQNALKNVKWNERLALVRNGVCNITRDDIAEFVYDEKECLAIDFNKPNWLMLGDSYGSGAYAIFEKTYPKINFLQLTLPGCRLNSPKRISDKDPCSELQKMAFGFIQKKPNLIGVIIASNWTSSPTIVDEIVKTIKSSGKKVIVLNQRISFKERVPVIVAGSMNKLAAIRKANSLVVSDRFQIRDRIKERLKEGTTVVDILELQCPSDCDIFDTNNKLLYLDDSHFSPEGFKVIGGRLLKNYGHIFDS